MRVPHNTQTLRAPLTQAWFNSRYWLHDNYFFLNLRVSWAKIENLKWRIGGDIIPLTFRKFVMLLVKKLKILRKKMTCSQYFDWQFLLSLNILSFWTYNVTKFPKVSGIISPPIRDLRFSIGVPDTLEWEWQCSQYLELNPTCGAQKVRPIRTLSRRPQSFDPFLK